MIQVCPTCHGTQPNCPTCGMPPRRVLPAADIYRRGAKVNKLAAKLYGAPVWEVQAVDLCVYSGTVNFTITKTKCQSVILRYGYGYWKDAKLEEYYRGAKLAGMPIGGYWYNQIRTDRDPIQTADCFAELLAMYPVDLDEHDDNEESLLSTTATLAWIIANEDRLKARTNKVPVPYSSKNFWDNKVAWSTRWQNLPDWVANWTTRDYPVEPSAWTFKEGDWWQHSANGNGLAASYGSTGGDTYIDLNRWYGSIAKFNTKYHTNIQPIGGQPPAPPPGTVPANIMIITGELSIHNTPHAIQQNVVGHALLNAIWHPYEETLSDGIYWYRVTKDGWISKNYTRPA